MPVPVSPYTGRQPVAGGDRDEKPTTPPPEESVFSGFYEALYGPGSTSPPTAPPGETASPSEYKERIAAALEQSRKSKVESQSTVPDFKIGGRVYLDKETGQLTQEKTKYPAYWDAREKKVTIEPTPIPFLWGMIGSMQTIQEAYKKMFPEATKEGSTVSLWQGLSGPFTPNLEAKQAAYEFVRSGIPGLAPPMAGPPKPGEEAWYEEGEAYPEQYRTPIMGILTPEWATPIVDFWQETIVPAAKSVATAIGWLAVPGIMSLGKANEELEKRGVNFAGALTMAWEATGIPGAITGDVYYIPKEGGETTFEGLEAATPFGGLEEAPKTFWEKAIWGLRWGAEIFIEAEGLSLTTAPIVRLAFATGGVLLNATQWAAGKFFLNSIAFGVEKLGGEEAADKMRAVTDKQKADLDFWWMISGEATKAIIEGEDYEDAWISKMAPEKAAIVEAQNALIPPSPGKLDQLIIDFKAAQKRAEGQAAALRQSARILYTAAENAEQFNRALDLTRQAIELDRLYGWDWLNPYNAWTWQLEGEDQQEKFLRAVAWAELQRGRPLTRYEIVQIRDRFVSAGTELAGEMVFDLLNFVPAKVFDFLLVTPAKALGIVAKEVGLKTPIVGSIMRSVMKSATRSVGYKIERAAIILFNDVAGGAKNSDDLIDRLGRMGDLVDDFNAGKIAEAEMTDGLREIPPRLNRTAPVLVKTGKMPALSKIPRVDSFGDWIRTTLASATDGLVKAYMDDIYENAYRARGLRGMGNTAKVFADAMAEAAAKAGKKAKLEDIVALLDPEIKKQARKIASSQVSDPKLLARGFGQSFREAYWEANRAWTGSKLLKGQILGELGAKVPWTRGAINATTYLTDLIFRAWVSAVLTTRPGWVMFNYIDSAARFVIMGGSLLDDLATTTAGLIDNGFGIDPNFLGIRLGLGDEKWSEIAEQIARGEGPKVYNWLTAPVAGTIQRIGKLFGQDWLPGVAYTKWTQVTTALNDSIEFSLRIRLFAKKAYEITNTLDPIALDRMLAQVPEKLQPLYKQMWIESGNNPDKFMALVDSWAGGVGQKPGWALTIPEELLDTPIGHTAQDQQQILGAINKEMRELVSAKAARKESLTLEDIDNLFDDILDSFRKRYEEIANSRGRLGELSNDFTGKVNMDEPFPESVIPPPPRTDADIARQLDELPRGGIPENIEGAVDEYINQGIMDGRTPEQRANVELRSQASKTLDDFAFGLTPKVPEGWEFPRALAVQQYLGDYSKNIDENYRFVQDLVYRYVNPEQYKSGSQEWRLAWDNYFDFVDSIKTKEISIFNSLLDAARTGDFESLPKPMTVKEYLAEMGITYEQAQTKVGWKITIEAPWGKVTKTSWKARGWLLEPYKNVGITLIDDLENAVLVRRVEDIQKYAEEIAAGMSPEAAYFGGKLPTSEALTKKFGDYEPLSWEVELNKQWDDLSINKPELRFIFKGDDDLLPNILRRISEKGYATFDEVATLFDNLDDPMAVALWSWIDFDDSWKGYLPALAERYSKEAKTIQQQTWWVLMNKYGDSVTGYPKTIELYRAVAEGRPLRDWDSFTTSKRVAEKFMGKAANQLNNPKLVRVEVPIENIFVSYDSHAAFHRFVDEQEFIIKNLDNVKILEGGEEILTLTSQQKLDNLSTMAKQDMDAFWKAWAKNNELDFLYGEPAGSYENFASYLRKEIPRATKKFGKDSEMVRFLEWRLAQAEQTMAATASFLYPEAMGMVPPPVPVWEMPESAATRLLAQEYLGTHFRKIEQGLDIFRNATKQALESGAFYDATKYTADEIADLRRLVRDGAVWKQEIIDVARNGGVSQLMPTMSFEGAAPFTNRTMIDYTDFSAFDEGMRNFFPFWKFYKNSIPFWIETMALHPEIAAFYTKYLRYTDRIAWSEGAINSRGETLPSLKGKIRIPGTDIWVNLSAPFSLRFVFPRLYQPYEDQDEEQMGPLGKTVKWLYDFGSERGLSIAPWTAALLYGTGVLNQAENPKWSVFPMAQLVPPNWQRRIVDWLRGSTFGTAVADWMWPDVAWKDMIVERELFRELTERISAPGLTDEEKYEIAQEYCRALGGQACTAENSLKSWDMQARENNKLWLAARDRVEKSDYYLRTVGFFTGFYGRVWTDADAELIQIRNEINQMKDAVENQLLAAMFGMDDDASNRYTYYIENRYNTPEGYVNNLYQATQWVISPTTGEQLYGPDRRDLIAQRIMEDSMTTAYYDSVRQLGEQLDGCLGKLPIGAAGGAKGGCYERYFEGRLELEDTDMYKAANRPWVEGLKPSELVVEHYQEMWWYMVKATKPKWRVEEGEEYGDWQQRVAIWQAELPAMAQSMGAAFVRVAGAKGWFTQKFTEKNLQDMIANTTAENYAAWQLSKDRPFDAIDNAWDDIYYSQYWDAIRGKTGAARELAEREFYKQWESPPTFEQLWGWIEQNYPPGQFTKSDIWRAYNGRDVETVESRIEETKSEWDKMEDDIWAGMNLAGPLGSETYDELIDLFIRSGGERSQIDFWFMSDGNLEAYGDPEDAQAFYESFMLAVNEMRRLNKIKEPTDAELRERAVAEELNSKYKEQITQKFGENIYWLLGLVYGEMNASERNEWKKSNTEDWEKLQAYFDFKDTYSAANPLWARYYNPDFEAGGTTKQQAQKVYTKSKVRRKGPSRSGKAARRYLGSLGGTQPVHVESKAFLPLGRRGGDITDLLTKGLGRGGYSELPRWPADLKAAVGDTALEVIDNAHKQGQPYPISLKQLILKLRGRHPEWREYIDRLLHDEPGLTQSI